MDRIDVIELIAGARRAKGLKWADIAVKLEKSKEWVTAACLGQMTFSAEQAAALSDLLDLPGEAAAILQTPPIVDHCRRPCPPIR